MKCKNVFSLKLLSAAIILSIAVFSCTSNDTNESSAATPADTATAPALVADNAMTGNTVDNKSDIAKPNPAKKGLKGKVTLVPAPPQDAEAKMEADTYGIYSNVEILPSFPGGYNGMQKYFDKNLVYPEEAGNEGVEGTVNLTFIVDENGKLTNPQVIGQRLGYGMEAEALRVVNTMPAWNPGQLKGKNVKTRFTLPIRFVLG